MGTAFGDVMAVYFGGRLEEGIALAGEVSGRIRSVEPVADVLADTIDGFRDRRRDVLLRLTHLRSGA